MKKKLSQIVPVLIYAGSILAVSRLELGSGPRLVLNLIIAAVYLVAVYAPRSSLRQWATEHKLLVPALSFSVLILLLPGWGSVGLALIAAAWLIWLSVGPVKPALVALV